MCYVRHKILIFPLIIIFASDLKIVQVETCI